MNQTLSVIRSSIALLFIGSSLGCSITIKETVEEDEQEEEDEWFQGGTGSGANTNPGGSGSGSGSGSETEGTDDSSTEDSNDDEENLGGIDGDGDGDGDGSDDEWSEDSEHEHDEEADTDDGDSHDHEHEEGEDTDADDDDGHLGGLDGDVDEDETEAISDAPGCFIEGALCYAFDGPLWATTDTEMFCESISDAYEAEGAPAMTYSWEGCPSGALAVCEGLLLGADSSGALVSGSDVSMYYYTPDTSGDIAAQCIDMGGTYSEL